ncbi:phage holin family protein [Microlunatus soli]|uniref:Putative Holin-X, holin superfamily III n=1 Tax=Microlunatus soli TaxID=630515 RepID=A0A1H1SZE2_9ACTN|nr:phage holin family protein [Microlunatus soli]SDS53274.1 Putative Holin-X, holin superfamily III [Microlunatus soli]
MTNTANSTPEQATSSTPTAPGVKDVFDKIKSDLQVLVKGEVELAVSELKPSAVNAGIGAGLFSGALYFVLNALILLFIAGSLAIWKWLDLPIALGFVIMAGVLIVVAGILGLIGYIRVKKVKPPQAAIDEGQRTADSVKAAIERGNAAASGKQIEGTVEPTPAVTADQTARR